MSAEHFETCLHVDVRTAPDGRSCEWTLPGAGHPRLVDNWDGNRSRTWFTTTPYADDAVRIAAMAVEQQPMDGISGDHPEKRRQAVAVMHAVADAVRALACDDAYDGTMTDEWWATCMERVVAAANQHSEPLANSAPESGAASATEQDRGPLDA